MRDFILIAWAFALILAVGLLGAATLMPVAVETFRISIGPQQGMTDRDEALVYIEREKSRAARTLVVHERGR